MIREPGRRTWKPKPSVSRRTAKRVWGYYTRMESTRPSLRMCGTALGIALSTVFRAVSHLEDLGYLQRETAHYATRTTGVRVLMPLFEG